MLPIVGFSCVFQRVTEEIWYTRPHPFPYVELIYAHWSGIPEPTSL